MKIKEKISKIELLSPVGDERGLKAAINAGADAVYFGAKGFNAREHAAENFDDKTIENAIKFAKLRNIKTYITVNTLVYNDEIDKVIQLIKNLNDMGADAIIVQDLGIIDIVRENFNIPMHASTQMSCNNSYSVQLLEKLGIERVVLARETSIENIKEIRKNTNIELETFIHGALCVSFSGQCAYSYLHGGRSANRGACAQPCRMEYSGGKTNYPLSSKDLMTIDIIPDLIGIGINSFKIEGRAKRSEYVAITTSIYRKAIDFAINNIDNKNIETEKYKESLIKIFNRGGFSKGYFYNSKDIFENYKPNHSGEFIGKITAYNKNKIYVEAEKELNVYDGLSFGESGKVGMQISDLYKDNIRIQKGKGALSFSAVLKDINVGDKVYRTTDKSQMDEANSIIESDNFKHSLNLNCIIDYDKKIKFKVSCDYNKKLNIEYISDYLAEEAKNYETKESDIIKALSKTGGTVFKFENINIDKKFNNPFIPIKILSEAKRNIINSLEKILIQNRKVNYDKNIFNKKIECGKTNIKVAIISDIKNIKDKIKDYDKIILFPKAYNNDIKKFFEDKIIDGIILPHITFDKDIELIKNIVSKDMIVVCNNLGQIEALLGECIIWAGIGMNTINNRTVDFLYKLGVSTVVSSIEAGKRLKNTISIKSGLIPAMNFAFCPKSIAIGCDKCKEKDLIDFKNNIVLFDCVRMHNKISFILENINNKNGEIEIFI